MENILGGGEWMNLAIHRMPFANVYPPIASFIFNCNCTHSSLANIFPTKIFPYGNNLFNFVSYPYTKNK